MAYDPQSYYSDCLKRMTNEYDQRDRDFLMHTTIAVALFAAIGFLSQVLRRDVPISWLLFGASVVGVAFIGLKSSGALKDSVRSFKYWQEFIEGHLAAAEEKFFPQDFAGLYKSALSATGKPTNVTSAREAMAETLQKVWRVIAIMSLIIAGLGAAAAFCPPIKSFVLSHI